MNFYAHRDVRLKVYGSQIGNQVSDQILGYQSSPDCHFYLSKRNLYSSRL